MTHEYENEQTLLYIVFIYFSFFHIKTNKHEREVEII